MISPLAAKQLPLVSPLGTSSHHELGAAEVPNRNTSAQEQKLRRAAHEFETLLISNFWKSMTESFSSGDEDSLDPAHSTLQDMGVQAMASAISKAGGLGFSKLILKHLEPILQHNTNQKGEARH